MSHRSAPRLTRSAVIRLAATTMAIALFVIAMTFVALWLTPQGIDRRNLHPDDAAFGADRYARVKPLPPAAVRVAGTCDGDGLAGPRVQLMYVRADDVPDHYAEYLASFQTWALEVDAVFSASASETNGDRHVRYVHDAACTAIVAQAVIGAADDADFISTVAALQARGFARTDRKYLLFMDAGTYCGISDWQADDSPDIAVNRNNQGPTYSWIGAQCWSQTVGAHELMHAMGGVQVTAPHSAQETHCWDMDDLMCRPTNGWPTQQICAWAGYLHFDCNHDDYYSTAPVAGSYLATHWNAANNKFLIGAPQPLPTPTPCFRGNSGKPCK